MSAFDEFRREHELWQHVERQRYEEQTHGGNNHRANPACAKCRAFFEPSGQKAKAIYDVDYMKVRNVVGVAVGGIPNPSGVLRIIAQIIDRAHKPVASPTGLCITSVRNDWAEWQQFLHEEGLVA